MGFRDADPVGGGVPVSIFKVTTSQYLSGVVFCWVLSLRLYWGEFG